MCDNHRRFDDETRVSCSQSKQISVDANADLMAMMANLANSMSDVKETAAGLGEHFGGDPRSLSFCDHFHDPTAATTPAFPWSGPIDNLDRLLRGRGLVRLCVQKASSHCQWQASAFLNHWTSGTLSPQGGQIPEWIPFISSAVGVHPIVARRLPTRDAQARDNSPHLDG